MGVRRDEFPRSNAKVSLVVDNRVEKAGIIEFGGLSKSTYIRLNELSIAEDNLLIIRGWDQNFGAIHLDLNIVNLSDQLSRVAFEINGTLIGYTLVTHWHWGWPYRNGWMYLTNSSDLWHPAPEPATYGAILAGGGIGLALLRRRRRKRLALKVPSLLLSCSHQ